MDALRSLNLTLRFALELSAIAALAYWGTQSGSGVLSWLLALAAAGLFVVVWGAFLAPRAPRRLPMRARIPLELVLFGLAAAALAVAGPVWLGVLLGIVAVVNIALVYALEGEAGGGATVSR
jgi:hypothetical protein